jgi:hypothetical protein
MNSNILKSYIKEIVRKEISAVKKIVGNKSYDDYYNMIDLIDFDNPMSIYRILNKIADTSSYDLNLPSYPAQKQMVLDYYNLPYYGKILDLAISDNSRIDNKRNIDPENFKKLFREIFSKNLEGNLTLLKNIFSTLHDAFLLKNKSSTKLNYKFNKNQKEDIIYIKNEWLIHYTDSDWGMKDIVLNGFKYGVDDPENLGYTEDFVHRDPESYENDSHYVFSYLVNSSDNNTTFTGKRYAVMFVSNGIQLHHGQDNENHVISIAKDAKNIVGLYRDAGKNWVIYQPGDRKINIPVFSRISDTKDWIMENYNQYRRYISVR